MVNSKKYYVAYRYAADYGDNGYSFNYATTNHDLSTEKGLVAFTQDIKDEYGYKTVIILNLIPLKD